MRGPSPLSQGERELIAAYVSAGNAFAGARPKSVECCSHQLFNVGVLAPLDLVVDFARTGQIGPVRCGMTLAAIEHVLGPFHDRMRDSKPRRWRPRLYFWDDLELLICHGVVIRINVPMWREEITLPAAVSGGRTPQPARLPFDVVLAALDDASIGWREDSDLVLDQTARGIRTVSTNVEIVFWPTEPASAGQRLHKVGKSDHSVDNNNHQPGQGRLDLSR